MVPPPPPATSTKREGWRAPLSRGDSTVSARDSTYWLAIASASSSISASFASSASSVTALTNDSLQTANVERPRTTDAKPLLVNRRQLVTSPLHCDAFANPFQRALQTAANTDTTATALRRRAASASRRVVVQEAVFENQRYQHVLGWGSKGHLLPLDPGKFMRALRRPPRRSGGGFFDRKSQRRYSLNNDCTFNSLQLPAERYSDPGSSDDTGDTGDTVEKNETFDVEWVHSPTFPDVPLPDCVGAADSVANRWEWLSPWHLEFAADTDARADADGWQYATSFQHFALADATTSTPTPSLVSPTWRAKHYVRCRKWVRYRQLTPSSDATSTRTSSAFDDAFLDSMSGWLRKRGHVRKNWKARYFVLDRSVLRYYADESCTRLKGEVLLFHPAARVHYVDVHVAGGRDSAFAVHVGRDYALLLEAAHLSDRERWIYGIEDALLCRDSYYQDDDDQDVTTDQCVRRRSVRESVALRRKLSAESMVFNAALHTGRVDSTIGALVGAQATATVRHAVQHAATSPVLRLLAECGAFLDAPAANQRTLAFLHTFKAKHSNGGGPTATAQSTNSSDSGGRRRSRGVSHSDALQPPATATAAASFATDDDSSSVAVLHDARSLSALKCYRDFVERSLSAVLAHLTQLPFVTGASPITSPRGWKPAAARGAKLSPRRSAAAIPLVSDDEWQLVRQAVLYKLERRTFLPLQDVLYSLLDATVCPDDLADFERNRAFLGTQPQAFFEIPASLASRSQWASATALLDTVDNFSLPSEKAAVLLEVARCIYATHARERQQGRDATDATDAPQMMAADDFLPIFIFILARCRLRNVVVTRHLISETMLAALMLGETGYYATMLEAAVGYIASFDSATMVPTTPTIDATTTAVTTDATT